MGAATKLAFAVFLVTCSSGGYPDAGICFQKLCVSARACVFVFARVPWFVHVFACVSGVCCGSLPGYSMCLY